MFYSFKHSMSHTSTAHDILTIGTDSRPPMLIPGTYTQQSLRFTLWLTHFDDGALMLKSIAIGPYVMKTITDPQNPTITQRQIDEDLNDTELDQYKADFRAKFFILLTLPNEIYKHLQLYDTVQDLWNALASLHREEEKQQIKEKLEIEIYFKADP